MWPSHGRIIIFPLSYANNSRVSSIISCSNANLLYADRRFLNPLNHFANCYVLFKVSFPHRGRAISATKVTAWQLRFLTRGLGTALGSPFFPVSLMIPCERRRSFYLRKLDRESRFLPLLSVNIAKKPHYLLHITSLQFHDMLPFLQ